MYKYVCIARACLCVCECVCAGDLSDVCTGGPIGGEDDFGEEMGKVRFHKIAIFPQKRALI